MDYEIDTFLTRFAAGAGWNGITQYEQFFTTLQPGEILVVCVKAAAM